MASSVLRRKKSELSEVATFDAFESKKIFPLTCVSFLFCDRKVKRRFRLRKEYLLKKTVESKENALRERREKVKRLVENGEILSASERDFEYEQRNALSLTDSRTLAPTSSIDDEYAYAGIKDPKIMLTTSRDPSNRLQQFVKELNLIFPNAHRLNRGSYIMKDLVHLSQKNSISDIVIVHEHRGVPDGLVISHMPLGPTVYFALKDVVLRHDLPNKPPPMSTAFPHLVFDNFTSTLGSRVATVLKHLFPPASPTTTRVLTFINRHDVIHFRHFVWEDQRSQVAKQQDNEKIGATLKDVTHNSVATKEQGDNEKKKKKFDKKDVKLSEVGPRFSLKVYRIVLGTLEMKNTQEEWSLKPYFNKPQEALSSSVNII
ncbi:U3 small nucleolar ribonucleoprotein protein IMP4-like [Hylaeus volcanicus]|uniref:U3 small nucleolar ribonucleoprotein protein IMP4-like n=1 Tax=Hylaeus volcanicus TaxID=313075 RepID=UPI0023B7F9B5|nr:U3 small nucleolar ribonucleoprotein protein IMP4-like [Hylaeus volcanicus]